jgi:hypothetical protein
MSMPEYSLNAPKGQTIKYFLKNENASKKPKLIPKNI